ncbi:hypothetical protein Tsubulata_020552 [Turnera subulata]|uniref:ABC-type xenobiotic transporter n=1 Tax=Turnera subulata TaxID=218843 RepID=A0A9Q0JB52_9ROSI|nr:hypothetical protein Tsubulata_020552 [Turnera subulata]
MLTVWGFGGNVLTITIIFILAISAQRNSTRVLRISFTEKLVFNILPAIGACVSFVDFVLLLKQQLINGDSVVHHEWLLRSSQLLVWAIVIVSSRCACSNGIFYNWFLCFWWIIKSVLGIVHLHTTFSSCEILELLEESFVTLLDVVFSISINIMKIKRAPPRSSSMEDPLLPLDRDIEEGCGRDSENVDSYWDLLTFKSITSVMRCGVLKQLDFEDLLWLPNDMEPSACHDKLLKCWRDEQCNSNPFFFKAICCAYGWPYLCLGLLKVINDCIGFAGPLLLNKLIRFLQQGSKQQDGYLLALSLGLTSILKSFLDTQYTFHLAKLKLKLRSSIMMIIYDKCLHVNLAERSKFSEGEIQTFMSVDADRTVNVCNSFHDIWSLPLQIGVALYLLYTQVRFAFLSGLAITILLIPVNKWISELIASATEKMMKQKDERIRKTGEILAHIRTLKMYSWECLFSNWLMETRTSEVKHLATRKYLDAWCVFFWATTPTLFSLFTFGLYTLMGHQLDAATAFAVPTQEFIYYSLQVFTCLALFNNLISPLNSFPWVINGLIDAFISTRRLSRFLSCPEYRRHVDERADSVPHQSYFLTEDIPVIVDDACLSWSSSDEKEQNLILDHVTLRLPKGSFVAIIGEVGSGKSSLLNALLGEMSLLQGSVSCNGSVAFVPQVPCILSGTVRDNILFGKNYDSKRYLETVKACALDIDISHMAGGDMAHIGEKGSNLSGGQRARLALARAVYQGSDIYLLDDVLSAVDAHVARWILQNAILGPLMDQKTCILCTHNIQAISYADVVVVLGKGHVKWMGSSSEFAVSSHSLLSPQHEFDTLSDVQGQASVSVSNDSLQERESLNLETDSAQVSDEAHEIVEVEKRKEGRVELFVYKSYAAFSGWFITVVIFASAILMQASRNGNDLWLSFWVDTTGTDDAEFSTSFYLAVLGIFCIINSSLTLVRAFSFAFGGLRAAVQVHNTLLNKLIDAPVQFFDQTPGGRILNRMSSDLYTIDDSLPFIMNILLANFVGLLGIAVVLSYVQVFFLLLLLPFWLIYSKLQLDVLQFFYRSTSRELRRLDSVCRSPIYATFTETLDAASTIRAFNSESVYSKAPSSTDKCRYSTGLLLGKIHRACDLVSANFLYRNNSEFVAFTASPVIILIRNLLQFIAAFIISFVAVMAVVGSRRYLPITFGTPGLVGLALSYAAPIVSLLGSFLTSFTETEKEMVSVERVLQVGIVGRTGAGKSSILNALFRLTQISGGCILVDGLNIVDVPVRDLRSHFSVVPQSPFLFEGSLRDNLDPLRMSNDLRIWDILEKCHVKEEVEKAGGLDIQVKESGSSFSVGQRQLLCLARALLKASKVLCLDECTANVDSRTASVLQNTISTQCRGMTVITIAHRISTVLSMDSILVLDRGNLAEEGNPQDLLQNEFSMFSSFAKASTM